MSNELIDRLVNDLKPRKPISCANLWLYSVLCFAAAAALIITLLGIRQEYQELTSASIILWKPFVFLLASLSGLLLINDISRPNGTLKKIHFAPMALALILFAVTALWQLKPMSGNEILLTLFESGSASCLKTISAVAAIIFTAMWLLWLRKTASFYPSTLGALGGFCAGCLAALAYSLHCDRDMTPYIALYYFTPIISLTFIGSVIGKRRLNW